jgi:ABC-2 type transport system ATP-binding protein
MSNVLEVSKLNKNYSNFSLKDVSFSLPEGCIGGFIGINGAGKTTTIRSILQLAREETGNISILGLDMNTHEKEIKDRIGIVMDENYFYSELTLDKMKEIIAPAYSKWSDNDYKKYLTNFDLNPKQKIKTLSKGMRMKYSLALALSHNAELLIMDEPTSGLDPLIRSELLEILSDYMKKGGKGVFFSTHITSDLDKIADMLILIDNGRTLFERSKDELLDDFRVVKGDKNLLNKTNRSLFHKLEISDYGFTGITENIKSVQHFIPEVIIEKATIEDIMLAYVKGEKSNVYPN